MKEKYFFDCSNESGGLTMIQPASDLKGHLLEFQSETFPIYCDSWLLLQTKLTGTIITKIVKLHKSEFYFVFTSNFFIRVKSLDSESFFSYYMKSELVMSFFQISQPILLEVDELSQTKKYIKMFYLFGRF